MISSTGVFVSLLITLLIFPRLIYFAIVNKRSYDNSLFEGYNLFFFIASIVFAMSSSLIALFFSNDFLNLGIFIVWMLVLGLALSLYLLFWSVFIMRGANPKNQFKKIIVPFPLTCLETMSLILTSVFTMNYYLLFSSIAYAIFAYLWNIKGYRLGK